jgi:hypothetical protein
MSAKWLRHGIVRQACLRHALMAGSAAIDNIQTRQPDLIDIRIVVRQEFLGVGPPLREFYERPFVLQPACVPQGHTQDQPGPLKNVPTTVKQSAVAMNHVITHQESGFCRSVRVQPAVAVE